MNSYLAGTSVALTIPFVDANGATLVPTGLTYTLTDGEGDVIVSSTVVTFQPGDTETIITVSGPNNALAVGNVAEARVLTLNVTTTEGLTVIETPYAVKLTSLLSVPNTSFQSWAQAQVEMIQMGAVPNFSAASRSDQESALIEAYIRLTRFSYEILEGYDVYGQINWPGETSAYSIRPVDWAEMPSDQFDAYPAAFRQAIRRAQIAEADDVLTSGSPNDRRRLGLLSESIGESSMMFRTGKPAEMGASPAAMRYISRYVRRGATIGRA